MNENTEKCGTLVLIGFITGILISIFLLVIMINKFDPIHNPKKLGETCSNNECLSGLICHNGICLGLSGMSCQSDNDCASGICIDRICY